MKRLIAKRPILYLGRMYQEGEALPGGDAKMVDAWVRNKSAEWSGENAKTTQGAKGGQDGTQDTQGGQDGTQGTQDTKGGQDGTQDGQDGTQGTQDGQDGTQGTQDGQDGTQGTQDGQDGQDGTQDGTQGGGMIAGHLDPKDLEDLKKADLERMATDMGLEISKAKTKADLIAVITAAEVYAPAKNENGGAQ